MKNILTQDQVRTLYPVAYAALPEAYKADSCLDFSFDGILCAYPKESQVPILGNWTALYMVGQWQTFQSN